MQFDVYRRGGRTAAYLPDVQSNQFDHYVSRTIVPLVDPSTLASSHMRLNPRLIVQGREVIMMTQALGMADRHILKKEDYVENLLQQRDEIVKALDTLFDTY